VENGREKTGRRPVSVGREKGTVSVRVVTVRFAR